jgi:hypothetical protein
MLIGEKPMTGLSAALAAVAVVQPAASAIALAAATTRVMCFTNTPYLLPIWLCSNYFVRALAAIFIWLQAKSNGVSGIQCILQMNNNYLRLVMVSL